MQKNSKREIHQGADRAWSRSFPAVTGAAAASAVLICLIRTITLCSERIHQNCVYMKIFNDPDPYSQPLFSAMLIRGLIV